VPNPSSMRRPTTIELMAAAFAVALVIVFLIRLGIVPGEKLENALRATARWSFFWFWPASAGGALAMLFGPRFQGLARRGRDFGLAFASAHLVHVGLVAYLYAFPVNPPPRASLIFFGIGVFWTYLLALLSIKRLAAMLNPRLWRILRTLGVEYISLAFLVDFAKNPFQDGVLYSLYYLPFQIFAVAGPILRIAALVKRLTLARMLATPRQST
jgi:hypothetical protein